MTTALWFTITFVVILLLLSAFFSGSETALTAASRARIHQMTKTGSSRAKTVETLTASKDRLIGALLLGNNLVNILASSLMTSILIAFFGESGVVYATLAMTLIIVVFSEVLPKTLAINQPDDFALAVAPIIRPIVALFAPITSIIQVLVRAILKLFGFKVDQQRSGLTGLEELRGTVDLLHKEGEVVKKHRDMLGGLLDLSDLDVSDIMVHRTRMLALDSELPTQELVEEILSSPYTRMPLYKDDMENIIGVIHAKDVLRAMIRAEGKMDTMDVLKLASKPWFIPETTPLQAQLTAFLRENAHLALVIDEYGEVQGLLTLEDILEEIVGDIADEHDAVIQGISKQADGAYLIDGDVPIRDVNRSLDWDLPEEEATTIAGLVIHESRTIPNEGQVFTFHGFRFRVVRKERNRILQLRVSPLAATLAS